MAKSKRQEKTNAKATPKRKLVYKKYTLESRKMLVQMVIVQELSIAEAARRLKIRPTTARLIYHTATNAVNSRFFEKKADRFKRLARQKKLREKELNRRSTSRERRQLKRNSLKKEPVNEFPMKIEAKEENEVMIIHEQSVPAAALDLQVPENQPSVAENILLPIPFNVWYLDPNNPFGEPIMLTFLHWMNSSDL